MYLDKYLHLNCFAKEQKVLVFLRICQHIGMGPPGVMLRYFHSTQRVNSKYIQMTLIAVLHGITPLHSQLRGDI